MSNTEDRLMDLEMAVANSDRMLEDINQVVIEHAKKIEALIKRNMEIIAMLNQGDIKAAADETPPPHY